MLLRPTRLPRRFSRRVSKGTAAFVKRRHQRRRQYVRERWARGLRKSQRFLGWTAEFLRQWFLLTVCTILGLAFAALLFSPIVHVREVRIKRTDPRLDSEKIQRSLKPVFGRHLFFLDPSDVRVLVQDAMPDAEDVTVDKQYPSTLSLTVKLHPLVARLKVTADSAPPSGSGAKLAGGSGAAIPSAQHEYLSDNGLYISLPFEAASSTALPLITVVDWAVHPVPSTPLFSADLLKRMQEAEGTLRDQFGLTVTGRTVYMRAREFHCKTSKYVLWFDMATPLADQFQRYKVFLQNAQPGEVKEYVDLRLVGRIVYR